VLIGARHDEAGEPALGELGTNAGEAGSADGGVGEIIEGLEHDAGA
jgi:hypothetical protein